MRKKEKRANLTPGGSLIEIKRGLEDEGQRLRTELSMVVEEARRTVAPWAGDVANYWICALLSAPEWVRDWAAIEGRKIWEEHLASPRPIEFRPIESPHQGPMTAESVVEARPLGSHGTGGEPGIVAKGRARKPKPIGNH